MSAFVHHTVITDLQETRANKPRMINYLPAPNRIFYERSNPNPEVEARCRQSVTSLKR
ncbi:hypothetical protein N9V94_02240 [bacterium]|nr:hypothetical protein [Verrucomicrobiales bacterium]MDB2327358.1 hypothetical protein [bacterium]